MNNQNNKQTGNKNQPQKQTSGRMDNPNAKQAAGQSQKISVKSSPGREDRGGSSAGRH